MNSIPIQAAVAYLLACQHPSGSWTDFWLPVGTSDEWVTAYVGLAMQRAGVCPLLERAWREDAAASARRAAHWLLEEGLRRQGWGYNQTVAADADSTAYALTLLARLGLPLPRTVITFLASHRAPEGGFRTYDSGAVTSEQWTTPCPDVTASALHALYEIGHITHAELETAWQRWLLPWRTEDGWWQGYWWMSPNYTTGLILELWRAAGCPPPAPANAATLPTTNAFDLAWSIMAYHHVEQTEAVSHLLPSLLALQAGDGGWPSAPFLRVPPANPRSPFAIADLLAHDARRLFTTASALSALVLTQQLIKPGQPIQSVQVERASSPWTVMGNDRRSRLGAEEAPLRSALGLQLDKLVADAAQAIGLPEATALQVATMYATLTRHSLADPCPWPSSQLSTLSGGSPLEFSVTVGKDINRALRYATEVGDPFLPPYKRACAALEDIALTVDLLGYKAAWERVLPAIGKVVASNIPAPDGLQFWVWSGIDHVLAATGIPVPGLKIYLNLLHRDVGNARVRLEAALRSASIPISSHLGLVLDQLDSAGFLHELGFGLGPNGKIACKIYYELHGWRRNLVLDLLRQTDLPSNSQAVVPEIPGILRETLATKSRAGIALRIDPVDGHVRELTTAAEFPPPMLTPIETSRRVGAWIDSQGWDNTSYQGLTNLLLPAWEASTEFGRLHSLFTRTISNDSIHTTIYLRPYIINSATWAGR